MELDVEPVSSLFSYELAKSSPRPRTSPVRYHLPSSFVFVILSLPPLNAIGSRKMDMSPQVTMPMSLFPVIYQHLISQRPMSMQCIIYRPQIYWRVPNRSRPNSPSGRIGSCRSNSIAPQGSGHGREALTLPQRRSRRKYVGRALRRHLSRRRNPKPRKRNHQLYLFRRRSVT